MRVALCGLFGLFCLSAFAMPQAEHPGEVHVPPSTSREGVRISLNPSGPVPKSPEAAKILGDLVAANGMDMQPQVPWHVEVSYDEFDEDGDNVHSGTIEEFYVSPKKYRKIIKTDEFSQVEVANGTDLYRAGDQNWPSQTTLQAMREILSPLYDVSELSDFSPDKLDWTIGKTALPCIALRNGIVLSANGWPKFCYEPGSTLLRYAHGASWGESVYNNIVQFKGRYIARDVDVVRGTKPFLKIHLAKVESLQQPDGSLFLPPAGSPGPLTGIVTVPSGMLRRDPGQQWQFPRNIPRGLHGKVSVRFAVDKEGRVTGAHAIDGPEELRKPVEDEVKRIRFHPFLILDRPVEVESTTVYMFQ